MKIIADENIPAVREAFAELGEVETVNGRAMNAAAVRDAELLLVRSVTRVDERLLSGSRVRFVASATAGINHINLDYLEKAGIAFANAPGSNAISAAEYVIAAICHWSLQTQRPLPGLAVGIVGRGNVGSRVQSRCEALGMRCIANDPPLADAGETGLAPLEEALDCDIVTLHVPLVEAGPHPTRQLLDAERVEALRPGTLFINASRGEVLAEKALLERLRRRDDISAVLDVWENEPDIDPDMLRRTLLGTAHIAGYSIDGKIRGTEMIHRAACEFLGVEPGWSSADYPFPVERKRIDLNPDEDLREKILDAYDIETDSERLKAILDADPARIGQYFDHLRRHYPVRREFTEVS